MSAKSMTPVSSISEITTNTTMVALMKLLPRKGTLMLGLEPQIHKNIASSTSVAMIHSWRDGGPIAASSALLHSTISGLCFTSGRQVTYASSGTSNSRGMPSGAKPMNHCDQLTSTLTIFLAIESAAPFGASAVRNSELVTAVVANAVHIT